MEKIDFGGGLNAGQSPPHPPSKKASILDCSQEGLKKEIKGGTVVHRRKAFWGSEELRIA